MYLELESINRILKDLKKYMIKKTFPLTYFKILESNDKNLSASELDDSSWPSYHTGDLWGGCDRYFWFRISFTLPDVAKGQPVLFEINTGQAEGWDVSNPQFLCYVDGKLIQGLDINHRSILLTSCADPHISYTLALHAYSGLKEEPCCLKSRLIVPDLLIKDFYYNLKSAFDALCLLDANSPSYITLFQNLKSCIHTLDLRQIYSPEFYTSLRQANNFLITNYYTDMNTAGPLVTAIGHTHIDMAWLWTVRQTREKAIRSFSTVLNLMEAFPDYKFMASTPQLYAFVKEDAPVLYERIKEKVKEGRWEIDGGMWVEADCNLPSGESLIRQFLFGIRYFRQEFGIHCKTLWLPDVFGYSASLPQIMKKCGISYFFTSKLDWNDHNKLPHDTFVWEGLDGSQILTHLATATNAALLRDGIHAEPNPFPQTTYNALLNANQILGTWMRYQDKSLSSETLQTFGFGDGGGGPTEEMLENAKRFKYGTLGIPRIEINFQRHFFEHLSSQLQNHCNLPKWVGELYFEYHRGTYTSIAKNKRFNRKAELLYEAVETLSAFMSLMNFAYPQKQINSLLKLMLLNQFHDILPGTAIEEVYEQTDQDYHKLLSQGELLLQRALTHLTSQLQLSTPSLVVFNTLSYQRSDLVEVSLPPDLKLTSLIDDNGSILPVQFIEGGKKFIFFTPHLPSMGYASFTPSASPPADSPALDNSLDVTPSSGTCEGNSWFSLNGLHLDTPYYTLTFDVYYQIASLYDKTYNRQLIPEGQKGNVLEIYEDRPADYENWNIDSFSLEKKYELLNITSVSLIERGPLRACLEIIRSFYHSTVTQRIYFYPNLRRIDFKTSVNWQEQNLLLKAAFPTDLHTGRATYDIQYGNIERTTHHNTSWDEAQYEVCAHKWADLSEEGYGISLLNDCKYGYAIKDGTLKLTLIKCGTYPNPHADLGLHEFIYSLYPPKGTWREAGTQQEAYKLNTPPLTSWSSVPHPGFLPAAASFISIIPDNCMIEVVKKAEDSSLLVIRVFEYMNKRTKATISLYPLLLSVYECNLLEEDDQLLNHQKHSFDTLIKPYEIKTFKLQLGNFL